MNHTELPSMLAEYVAALEEEIEKIKNTGQSSTLLRDGQRIESHGVDAWYRFRVEYIPVMPPDTPCKLAVGKAYYDVTVVSVDENAVILSSKVLLPDALSEAELENGSTVLMERLIKCIEDNAKSINPAGNRMLPSHGKVYTARQLFEYDDLALQINNTPSQNRAIISAVSNDITYIWGPPGTGKTTVIGQIIDELYKHDRSVLVVSHTNTAVDGAIAKADMMYSAAHPVEDADYPILRLGIPSRPLPERVLLDHHLALLGQELQGQKDALDQQRTTILRRINEILLILAKSEWVESNQLKELVSLLAEMNTHTCDLREIEQTLQELDEALRQEKDRHPDYALHQELLQKLQNKKHESNCAQTLVHTSEQIITLGPERILHAQEECKKHEVYAHLCEKERTMMPEEFLRGELSKVSLRIAALKKDQTALIEKQTTLQQIVANYERKTALAKLFASKSSYTQSKSDLNNVTAQLQQNRDDLRRALALEVHYAHQLDELLVLQAQIIAVQPSETLDHWQKECATLQEQLARARASLPEQIAHMQTLQDELHLLEIQEASARDALIMIQEYEYRLQQEITRADKVKTAYGQAHSRYTDLLRDECSRCAVFYWLDESKTPTELLTTLQTLLIRLKAELADTDITVLVKEKEEAEGELSDVLHKLDTISQKMQELEKLAIAKAKIVGATLAKAYLSLSLRERKFDTVILDEASMASIPALWCASLLAEKNIVIVGDFLQLPPIVMAETEMAQKWLGKDIFYHSRMQELAKNQATCPKNFIMLNSQFRMEAEIADIANMYYGSYGGLLSDDSNALRVKDREAFYSWYAGKRTNHSVHLIDTESLHAWVTGVPQGKGHSRLNCFSAAVCVDLAFKCLENKLNTLDRATVKPAKEASVLIVAPYKPHISRVNQLINLEYRNRGFQENLNFIRAGTIHSFQGSEADIVIFDLVLDEPHWKANLFMPGEEIDADMEKLYNVAITRAKFKLYVVGNFPYCQKRAKGNALARLLNKLLTEKQLVPTDAKKLLPHLVYEKENGCASMLTPFPPHIICQESSFHDYFMTDVRSFKTRLIMFSPFMTRARLITLLPAFADAINAGKQVIVVTKALSDRSKKELTDYQSYEAELRQIGVSVLHKQKMHEKLIFVDHEAVWIGSLNVLSYTGLTGEVMQRHADHDLTAEYEKIFDIAHICGAIEHTYELTCPICAKEMLVKESADGGIYWQCAARDYARSADAPYPVDGLMRCKCGKPYVFAMKNEPRWVCSETPRHYQRMRESDLKLPKMAALIPNQATRTAVDKYFALTGSQRQ